MKTMLHTIALVWNNYFSTFNENHAAYDRLILVWNNYFSTFNENHAAYDSFGME